MIIETCYEKENNLIVINKIIINEEKITLIYINKHERLISENELDGYKKRNLMKFQN
jgi:hypothetical protein